MVVFWQFASYCILKYRRSFLLFLAIIICFLLYFATKIKVSNELPKILPKSDSRFQLYESFKNTFGEDGSVLVLGIESQKMKELKLYTKWQILADSIQKLQGVDKVVYSGNVLQMLKDDSLKLFTTRPLIGHIANKQEEVDSVFGQLRKLPVYQNLIIDSTENVHLMLVNFDKHSINDQNRIFLVKKIKAMMSRFENTQNEVLHVSGMPFIRTEMTAQISNELMIFLVLAILVTTFIMVFFFRSAVVMFSSLAVVLVGIVSSLGIISLLDYKVTIISGLIPPLVVVIGVPNIIFLINKYHEEFLKTQNKHLSIKTAIVKIGPTLFLANVTTTIGFGVFAFTGSLFLKEFGIVASINIMLTYLVTMVFIPIVMSYAKEPTITKSRLSENNKIAKILLSIENLVFQKRSKVYIAVVGILLFMIVGITQIKSVGYIVDDLVENNPILVDLRFIEKNFKGVMPFEIAIDTYQAGRVNSPELLTKIKKLEKRLKQIPELTQPLSIVTVVKYAYQTYRGGNPKYYVLPGIDELSKLKEYSGSLKGKQDYTSGLVDSTARYTRISCQIADCGTIRTNEIIKELQPSIDSIFNYNSDANLFYKKGDKRGFDARITGNSVIYAWQNDFLQSNLIESTFQAIFLICLVMAFLFRSWKMVVISTIPSLIPLIITAGLMGFLDIHLKYSTILVFSIAFGISSDGTIYFLTRYKDELLTNKKTVKQAISSTILNTGISMFYTAIVLFAGFFIFAVSTFKGTQSLGILVSITLLMAMFCNLVLLPAFLMTLNKKESLEII